MKKYYLHDGAFHELTDTVEPPDDAVYCIRLPEEGEVWDAKTEEFALSRSIRADMQVSANHIDRAHLLKELEATMVLSGVQLTCGLLVQEAELKNMTVGELAAQVYMLSEEDRAAELFRMSEKFGGV